jgi:hypothetical protein
MAAGPRISTAPPRRRPWSPWAAATLVAAGVALTTPAARAGEPAGAPDASRIAEATAAFASGEQAFRAGDFTGAAGHFERAHRAVPHHDAAWNAGQAWLEVGDEPRAADWLATYLDEAPPSAPDREPSRAKLAELAARLGRIELRAAGFERLRVDDAPVARGAKYVRPGTHAVEGTLGDRVVRQSTEARAGETVVVELRAPEPDAPRPTPAARTPQAAPAPPPPEGSRGWSPLVVVIGGVVTTGLAATSVVYGLATERARDEFATAPSQATFDDGAGKQDLANGFFWGALAAGVVTGAVAIFLVDWKRPLATRPGLSF